MIKVSNLNEPNTFVHQVVRNDRQTASRTGWTLVELLVVLAIIVVLIAMLLPAVSATREAARRTKCANNLKQLGLGLHLHHDAHSKFPSAYEADLETRLDGSAWGWGVRILPFLEQAPLFDQLNPSENTLGAVGSDPDASAYLQNSLNVFLCPSDGDEEEAHRFRSLLVFRRTGIISSLTHVLPGDGPGNGTTFTIRSWGRFAKSNYIGSLGSSWKPKQIDWTDADFQGNGILGRDSDVRMAMVTDGTSNTIAIGERSYRNYAAVWAGVNSWKRSGFTGNQMVIGTAFYPINDDPVSLNIGADGRGAANFSSNHWGGANFLLSDGAVRFISDQIDSRPNGNGVYQNLAQRNDGEPLGAF